MDGNGNGEVSQDDKDKVAKAGKDEEEHNSHTIDHPPPWTGGEPLPEGNWNGPPGEYFTGRIKLPPVPKHDGKSGVPVQVSTEALKLYAGNLRELIKPLKELLTDLGTVELRPGSFFDANALTVRVVGDTAKPGLVGTTVKFINDAISAVTVVADQLESLAGAYTTAEELNAATGKDVTDYIENAKTFITKALGTGTPG
ncbi:hypothetical protein ACIA49_36435 [Kribbella sp. NPDC051587]|uniref:hypothetical protein n=1 Tax=Kribbella sp. NPDC051587 TaxID=3364119 RepID=UPI0037A99FAC